MKLKRKKKRKNFGSKVEILMIFNLNCMYFVYKNLSCTGLDFNIYLLCGQRGLIK